MCPLGKAKAKAKASQNGPCRPKDGQLAGPRSLSALDALPLVGERKLHLYAIPGHYQSQRQLIDIGGVGGVGCVQHEPKASRTRDFRGSPMPVSSKLGDGKQFYKGEAPAYMLNSASLSRLYSFPVLQTTAAL